MRTRSVHMQEDPGEAFHKHRALTEWKDWPLRSTRLAEPGGLATITLHWSTYQSCPQNAALRESLSEKERKALAPVSISGSSPIVLLKSCLASSYTYPQGILLRHHNAMASHISNHFNEVCSQRKQPTLFSLYIIFEYLLPSIIPCAAPE